MNLQNAVISINTGADNTIISGVTGAQIKIWDLFITNTVGTLQTVTVKDGTAGTTLAPLVLPSAIGGQIALINDFNPQWILGSGNNFVLTPSQATLVTGFVQYSIG